MISKSNLWIVIVLFGICLQNVPVCSLTDLILSTVKLRCYRGAIDQFTEVGIRTPDGLITDPDPCVDKLKPTIVSVTGFGADADGEAAVGINSAVIASGKYNAILLNWAKASYGIGLGPLGFPTAITNSKIIANSLANATVRLIELGLSKDIHYVGHSLGGQLVGEAGRDAIKMNFTVPRITSLDPGRPLFEPTAVVYPTVSSECGGFVVIGHCDPGGYAVEASHGHVDVFFNYGLYENGTRRQPGCARGYSPNELVSNGNSCSHTRCWQFFSSAVNDPGIFKVGFAPTYDKWVTQNGSFSDVAYFGPDMDTQIRGNAYCKTSDTAPWGIGDAGLFP